MKFTLALVTLLSVSAFAANDWSRFRGPNGSGVVETTGLPSIVDDSTTLWKAPLGKGWSSPVLWGDMVVVTAETAANKRAVIALSAKDGKELWRHEEEFVPHNIHKTYNTFASSSAFIDAGRIYINWSTGTNIQALALDHGGKLVWKNDHVTDYIHEHGTGISPVVADGIMIVRSEFDWQRDGKVYTEDPEQQKWKACFVGLDAATGKQAWKLDIPNCLNTFSTPVVHELKNGKKEFICANNASGVMGIDVTSGKINWQHNPGYKPAQPRLRRAQRRLLLLHLRHRRRCEGNRRARSEERQTRARDLRHPQRPALCALTARDRRAHVSSRRRRHPALR
jgi:outer membrane protein assembly factor BamB